MMTLSLAATDSSVLGYMRSLADNYLTGYSGDDMSGVIQLAEALKTSSCLRELKCAPLDP